MRKRLGEILLERQLLTVDQLNTALAHQRQWSMRLGAALIAKGFITERQLTHVLSESLGIPLVDLSKVVVDQKALAAIPVEVCEQHDLFPIAIKQQKGRPFLLLAMADPLNFGAIDELAFSTGCKIQPAIAQLSSVGQAIRRFYYQQKSVVITPLDADTTPLSRTGRPVSAPAAAPAALNTLAALPAAPAALPVAFPLAPPAAPRPPPRAEPELPVIDGDEFLADLERPELGGPGQAPPGSFTPLTGPDGIEDDLPLIELLADNETGTFAVPTPSAAPPRPAAPAQPAPAPQEQLTLKALAANETESLEEKFWALMQVLNARGVVTREEFLAQLRQRK